MTGDTGEETIMTVVYERFGVTVHAGDCLDVLARMPASSVHAVVTDPPYGLRFMGKAWDGEDIAAGVSLRRSQAAMPDDGKAGANGGYRSAAAEAGRYDLSANAAFGEWCRQWTSECLRVLKPGGHLLAFGGSRTWHRLAAAVEDAGFEGWGTALKPAFEPIVVARKPLVGTVAGNVLEYGVGALNIDGCRIEADAVNARANKGGSLGYHGGTPQDSGWSGAAGRWPSNVVLTHTPLLDPVTGEDACADGCVPGCLVAELDEQAGVRTSGLFKPEHVDNGKTAGVLGEFTGRARATATYGDSGGASRFFPVFRFEAKAPASERPRVDGVAHPTVKPLALMRWLVRLVTPPGGTVLDPFLGSGTTAQAARAESFQCVGIEREETYLPLIRARLDGDDGDLFGAAS